MKRAHQPRKAVKLSESVQHRLSMYALMAGAAGVGTLVLEQPAQARIVYTHADRVLERSPVLIDLNHDGINDFKLQSAMLYSDTFVMLAFSLRSNRVFGEGGSHGAPASHLRAGYRIGPHQDKFQQGSYFILGPTYRRVGPAKILEFWKGSSYGGKWAKAKHGYLGLRFLIKGKIHYGWARISKLNAFRLTGYAYETIPNKPIIAGATKDAADENQPAGVSFKTNAPEPAALGMLALGAPGLSMWRREDGAAAPEGI
jgi:hypothetical protein